MSAQQRCRRTCPSLRGDSSVGAQMPWRGSHIIERCPTPIENAFFPHVKSLSAHLPASQGCAAGSCNTSSGLNSRGLPTCTFAFSRRRRAGGRLGAWRTTSRAGSGKHRRALKGTAGSAGRRGSGSTPCARRAESASSSASSDSAMAEAQKAKERLQRPLPRPFSALRAATEGQSAVAGPSDEAAQRLSQGSPHGFLHHGKEKAA